MWTLTENQTKYIQSLSIMLLSIGFILTIIVCLTSNFLERTISDMRRADFSSTGALREIYKKSPRNRIENNKHRENPR